MNEVINDSWVNKLTAGSMISQIEEEEERFVRIRELITQTHKQ